jgi:hypothetical protein
MHLKSQVAEVRDSAFKAVEEEEELRRASYFMMHYDLGDQNPPSPKSASQ